MSLRVVRAAASAELMDAPHEARLLLLLSAAGKRSGKPVDGLTKLAKLDFLLRYPNCLERALAAAGRDPSKANVQAHERDNIETKMIRFRYGPWDPRYRRWISLLIARGLAWMRVEGRTVRIGLTPAGQQVASGLAEDTGFQDLAERSRVAAQAFGDLSATRLKEFVYDTFPELSGMKWGEEIVI